MTKSKSDSALFRKGFRDGIRYYKRDLQVDPQGSQISAIVDDLIGVGISGTTYQNDPWVQGYLVSALGQQ